MRSRDFVKYGRRRTDRLTGAMSDFTELHVRRPDGVELFGRVEGDGPPLVLVHGVGSDLTGWDAIADRLRERFKVIRADLRGHGRSSHIEKCHISDFVGDLDAILDAAQVETVDLAGFSLGGLIAQWFVMAHPGKVRRVAFISAVAERTHAERTRVLERADKVRDEGIASVVTAAQDRWFTPAFMAANPEKVALRLRQLKANDHRSYAAAYRVFAEADEGVDFTKIRCPTLVATGENDIGSNTRMARRMHEAIAGSSLVIFPELRHSVLMEAPELISDTLLDFFK